MRTSRMLTLLGATLLALTTAHCNCGEQADCASIAPGTAVADIPAMLGPPQVYTDYCWPPPDAGVEAKALWCCAEHYEYNPLDGGYRFHDGVVSCATYYSVDCSKIAPAELRKVGAPYSDYDCAPDEGWGHPQYGCYVWVRDGGVVGVCGGCPPD